MITIEKVFMKKTKGYWTKERVFEEARKYKTKSELTKTNKTVYEIARRKGWLEEMFWFVSEKKESGYWNNRENVFNEASKYKTKNEFRLGCSRAYVVARKNDWLDEMDWFVDGRVKLFTDKIDCIYRYLFKETNSVYIGRTIEREERNKKHTIQKNDTVFRYAKRNSLLIPEMEIIEDNLTLEEGQQREGYWVEYYKQREYNIINIAKTGSLGAINRNKWTKEKVFEEARKYKTRSEFCKGCQSAYQVAIKNKWLEEMIWLISPHKPNGYWTKEKVFEEAMKYKTRWEFGSKCGSAYEVARKNGWIDEMDWFKEVVKPSGYWTKERIFEESKKYKTKTEFCKGSRGAHKIAWRNGWLDELFPQHKKVS